MLVIFPTRNVGKKETQKEENRLNANKPMSEMMNRNGSYQQPGEKTGERRKAKW
jgi:hypothetical protein